MFKMNRRRFRFIDVFLLAISAVAVTGLIGNASASENDGCQNNICRDIEWGLSCNTGNGIAYYVAECTACIFNGRCDGSDQGNCRKTDLPQKRATAEVSPLCDCANGNGIAIQAVEGYQSGTTIGDWVDSAVNAIQCTTVGS